MCVYVCVFMCNTIGFIQLYNYNYKPYTNTNGGYSNPSISSFS